MSHDVEKNVWTRVGSTPWRGRELGLPPIYGRSFCFFYLGDVQLHGLKDTLCAVRSKDILCLW